MREIASRTFYCEKLAETVTVVEFGRNLTGHEVVCGILSCSHQEHCAETKPDGERVFPWGGCPACAEPIRGR